MHSYGNAVLQIDLLAFGLTPTGILTYNAGETNNEFRISHLVITEEIAAVGLAKEACMRHADQTICIDCEQ